MEVSCVYGVKWLYNDVPGLYITMSSVYCSTAIPTTVLNLLVLVAIWKTPSLHKPSYVLLASMAAADLMNGLVTEPLLAVRNLTRTESWVGTYCLLTVIAKKFGYWTSGVSLLTITAISVDRLLAVKLKNRYQTVVTVRRVVCVMMLFWALPLPFAIVIGISYTKRAGLYYYLMITIGSLIFVLLVTILLCYSKAYCYLKKLTSSISPNNSEDSVEVGNNMTAAKYRKSLNTMVIVCVTLFLFYVPFVISSIVLFKVKDASIDERKAGFLSWQLGELIIVSNSAVNPVLYLWRMRDLRAAVNTITRGIFCGKCTDAQE